MVIWWGVLNVIISISSDMKSASFRSSKILLGRNFAVKCLIAMLDAPSRDSIGLQISSTHWNQHGWNFFLQHYWAFDIQQIKRKDYLAFSPFEKFFSAITLQLAIVWGIKPSQIVWFSHFNSSILAPDFAVKVFKRWCRRRTAILWNTKFLKKCKILQKLLKISKILTFQKMLVCGRQKTLKFSKNSFPRTTKSALVAQWKISGKVTCRKSMKIVLIWLLSSRGGLYCRGGYIC